MIVWPTSLYHFLLTLLRRNNRNKSLELLTLGHMHLQTTLAGNPWVKAEEHPSLTSSNNPNPHTNASDKQRMIIVIAHKPNQKTCHEDNLLILLYWDMNAQIGRESPQSLVWRRVLESFQTKTHCHTTTGSPNSTKRFTICSRLHFSHSAALPYFSNVLCSHL